MEGGGMNANEKRKAYWRSNLRATGLLLFAWFLVTFVVGFFARDLSFDFFGWPFSFWMGAQGALLVYVAIIWFYARYMARLDREYGIGDEADPRP
jgi:putative solute:sodium symporter small subunit